MTSCPRTSSRFNSAQHLDVDSTRLRNELGYVEPVGLTNALWQSVDWERALQLTDMRARG